MKLNDDIAPGGGKNGNARLHADFAPSVTRVITQLRREILDESHPSTPSGRVLVGEERAFDLGWRAGHNARARSAIGMLQQGDVEAGLRELAAAQPQLPRHWLAEISAFSGEGG